jgi:hypothetical protein
MTTAMPQWGRQFDAATDTPPSETIPVETPWPTVLRTYTGRELHPDEAKIWQTELGETNDRICKAIRWAFDGQEKTARYRRAPYAYTVLDIRRWFTDGRALYRQEAAQATQCSLCSDGWILAIWIDSCGLRKYLSNAEYMEHEASGGHYAGRVESPCLCAKGRQQVSRDWPQRREIYEAYQSKALTPQDPETMVQP